jgi:alanine dehydrogenase
MADALWVTEGDVADLVDLPAAVEALEDGFRCEADGRLVPVEKTHAVWGSGHTVHALGAVMEDAALVGVKSWAHTAGGAAPLLAVWDTETGDLVAVVEAFGLGQLRTAAATAVATKWMSDERAATLAVIGSGRQAAGQVAAVVGVRPIETVRAFSPTPAHRDALAAELRRQRPDLEVIAAPSVSDAVEPADIVITVTRARAPFLTAAMLGPGVHINAVGAITPERAELAADVVARASAVAVDSEPMARRLASELVGVHDLVPLSRIVADRGLRVTRPCVTVFKAMGTGLADMSVATILVGRARSGGRGRAIPQPRRATPNLWSRT